LADGLVQLRQLGRHDEDLAAAALAEHADRTVDEPLAIDVEQRLGPTHATRATCGEDQAVGSPGVSKRHRSSSGTASRLPSSWPAMRVSSTCNARAAALVALHARATLR